MLALKALELAAHLPGVGYEKIPEEKLQALREKQRAQTDWEAA